MPRLRNSNETFWLIFKQCVSWLIVNLINAFQLLCLKVRSNKSNARNPMINVEDFQMQARKSKIDWKNLWIANVNQNFLT